MFEVCLQGAVQEKLANSQPFQIVYKSTQYTCYETPFHISFYVQLFPDFRELLFVIS